ncbi:MAG: SMC-Scp complex subunit ScpB [bacterium]
MDASKAAIIEFFLFVSPNPLSVSDLKEMAGNMEIDQIEQAISWLQKNFYCPGRALQICEVAGGYQICTRPEFHPWLERITNYQTKRRLSRAALEVLAIVAYKQPITRFEVDEIRGVSSGFVLRGLLQKKLIRIAGRKDCLGRPIVYGTGKEFLSYFGLRELRQLPKESELKEIIGNEEKKC